MSTAVPLLHPLWVNGMSQGDLEIYSWWERGRRNECSWNDTILEQMVRIPMLCMLRQIKKTSFAQVKTVSGNITARLSAWQCYFSGPCIENKRNLRHNAVEPRQEIAPKGRNGASRRLFSFDKSQRCVQLIKRTSLTLRWLMSYIYIYIYISMEHPFLMFLDHTQRRSTVGRTPLDEWSARRRDLYLTTHDTHNRQISTPPVGFEPKISAGEQPQAARLLRSWVRIPPGASFFSLP